MKCPARQAIFANANEMMHVFSIISHIQDCLVTHIEVMLASVQVMPVHWQTSLASCQPRLEAHEAFNRDACSSRLAVTMQVCNNTMPTMTHGNF